MISERLAKNLGATGAVADAVEAQLRAAPSQTSLQERESLYAIARDYYSGEGAVFDIGCGSGGSSLCLALGLRDRGARGVVDCFDLFDGSAVAHFRSELSSDLELFAHVTRDVRHHVVPHLMNLDDSFEAYAKTKRVEIAHIDAAKSLSTWQAIFRGLAPTVVPGRTVWIFQDFERGRLPWQIYSLRALRDVGRFIGGSHYGTMYFAFDRLIPERVARKIAEDDFSFSERIDGVNAIYDEVFAEHAELFESEWPMNDLRTTTLAYCHYYVGDRATAAAMFESTDPRFRTHPPNIFYVRELSGN